MPLGAVLERTSRVVRLGYYTSRPAEAMVTVGDDTQRVRFEAGLHHLFLVVRGPAQLVTVDLAGTTSTICVTDLVVGIPRPTRG